MLSVACSASYAHLSLALAACCGLQTLQQSATQACRPAEYMPGRQARQAATEDDAEKQALRQQLQQAAKDTQACAAKAEQEQQALRWELDSAQVRSLSAAEPLQSK